MPGKGVSKWKRLWRWAPWVLALLLAVGIVVRCEMLKPKTAEVLWEVNFPDVIATPQIQQRPRGGFIVSGWEGTAFLDSQGKVDQFVPMPPGKRLRHQRSQANCLDAQGNYYFALEDEAWSLDEAGNQRWVVKFDPLPQNLSNSQFKGSNPVYRVSPEDHLLVLDDETGFSVLDRDGNLVVQPEISFQPSFNVAPLELPDGRFVIGMFFSGKPKQTNKSGLAVVEPNGDMVWRVTMIGGYIRQFELYAGGIFVQDILGNTYLFDQAGNIIWQRQCDLAGWKNNMALNTSRASVMDDGSLLLCSPGEVVCLGCDGLQCWQYQEEGLAGVIPLPGGECYAIKYEDAGSSYITQWLYGINQRMGKNYREANTNPKLLKLNKGNLIKRWSLPVEPFSIHGPSPDGNVYIFSMSTDKFYCVKPD